MKLYSAREMRAADSAAADAGIPLLLLMEEAGRAAAQAATTHFPSDIPVLVLCGKGNNGGDGYVAARHLLKTRRVHVLERSPTPTSEESSTMRDALLAHGLTPTPLESDTLKDALREHPLVLDALFGSGLTRALEDEVAEVVKLLGESGVNVLSLDLPSGLSADTGELLGPHVQATRTVQFAGAKISSLFYPAKAAFGAREVADIGIPTALLEDQSSITVITTESVRVHLPTRSADTQKYEVGTVLVIAGSARYLGAAEMACRAALRGGAGLVTLAAEGGFPATWPEFIHERLEWDVAPLETVSRIGKNRAQVRLIGPGLDPRADELLPALIALSDAPTVLDAGALKGSDGWFEAVRAHGHCVLTPHTGEASKLLETETSAVNRDPLRAAQRLAEHAGAIVVLKGATTVIAAPDGRTAVHEGGHPGMATGGTGDVLAGLLAAWCADDPSTLFDRACAGVCVHARAGVLAGARYGDGLIATDLVETIPQAWLELL